MSRDRQILEVSGQPVYQSMSSMRDLSPKIRENGPHDHVHIHKHTQRYKPPERERENEKRGNDISPFPGPRI